jgi:3-hydroxybutyrate dehydrogenase
MRLKDKVAIVTGAASGIGKEIAITFAREGTKIAVPDLDPNAADATAREIDPTGKIAIGVAMDVAKEEQVEAGTTKVITTSGALDVLVSNAGIQIVDPIVDFEFTKWKKLLAVHLICPGASSAPLSSVKEFPRRQRNLLILSRTLSRMPC